MVAVAGGPNQQGAIGRAGRRSKQAGEQAGAGAGRGRARKLTSGPPELLVNQKYICSVIQGEEIWSPIAKCLLYLILHLSYIFKIIITNIMSNSREALPRTQPHLLATWSSAFGNLVGNCQLPLFLRQLLLRLLSATWLLLPACTISHLDSHIFFYFV